MNELSNISFQAKPINKAIIQKFDKKTKQFMPLETNFVLIEHKNKYDIDAITKVAKTWKKATYVQNISTSAHWMNDKNFSHIKVYALTTQTKNLKKLSPSKILGLTEMRKDDDKPKNMLIRFLQVRPNAMHENQNKKPTFKRTGTAILDSVKKIYKNISLFSEEGVEPFYEINGFIKDNYGEGHYVWYSNKFKMLLTKLRVRWEDFRVEMAKRKF